MHKRTEKLVRKCFITSAESQESNVLKKNHCSCVVDVHASKLSASSEQHESDIYKHKRTKTRAVFMLLTPPPSLLPLPPLQPHLHPLVSLFLLLSCPNLSLPLVPIIHLLRSLCPPSSTSICAAVIQSATSCDTALKPQPTSCCQHCLIRKA